MLIDSSRLKIDKMQIKNCDAWNISISIYNLSNLTIIDCGYFEMILDSRLVISIESNLRWIR